MVAIHLTADAKGGIFGDRSMTAMRQFRTDYPTKLAGLALSAAFNIAEDVKLKF